MSNQLRQWQKEALKVWKAAGNKGIASVVTGAGKTVFALACIKEISPETTLIVVPTLALLEQWWEEASHYFGLELDDIRIIDKRQGFRRGAINIAVLNSAAKLDWSKASAHLGKSCLLIVDECHKAASEKFRNIFQVPRSASLGLSATPERAYDDWLTEILIPQLGNVIYEYTYKDALRDKLIVPFVLKNIVFDLEEDNQREYDKLTRSIARSIQSRGIEAEETIALLLRRSRILNMSLNRVKLALRLVRKNAGRRILVFHEDIEACNLIYEVLTTNSVKAGVYHSKLPLRERAETLAAFRKGIINVLVTCRALDEGFNVPEVEIGIVAASTATRRQRIQRLGRVLRPSHDKSNAVVYTLVATDPEVARLKEEEREMEGIAKVEWGKA